MNIMDQGASFHQASENMRFAASVAGYGMLLRDSPYKGSLNYPDLLNWIDNSINYDPYGFREEFRELVEVASGL